MTGKEPCICVPGSESQQRSREIVQELRVRSKEVEESRLFAAEHQISLLVVALNGSRLITVGRTC